MASRVPPPPLCRPGGLERGEQVPQRAGDGGVGVEDDVPVLVMQVNPVLAPVLAVGDELEVAAGQRVERVRHADASVPIMRIGCS